MSEIVETMARMERLELTMIEQISRLTEAMNDLRVAVTQQTEKLMSFQELTNEKLNGIKEDHSRANARIDRHENEITIIKDLITAIRGARDGAKMMAWLGWTIILGLAMIIGWLFKFGAVLLGH